MCFFLKKGHKSDCHQNPSRRPPATGSMRDHDQQLLPSRIQHRPGWGRVSQRPFLSNAPENREAGQALYQKTQASSDRQLWVRTSWQACWTSHETSGQSGTLQLNLLYSLLCSGSDASSRLPSSHCIFPPYLILSRQPRQTQLTKLCVQSNSG